ncbi:hypothetical protein J2X72_002552 [Phyllobacterium sp. 1468]|uniref:hypothetical protein n=1 Tax=Phyllobacterium sp. 1468 TaxID=2817759 RepID=UPI002860248D|nr:hypothetical protein [Phyllobacterium sp. 1468]MDR6633752.1 hypothetical protein [Phyllobacterium sp. 1468]
MMLREFDQEQPLEVYAFYWANNPALKRHGQRMHLVVLYQGHDGLGVVAEDECEIVDPSVDGFVLRRSGSGGDIFVHWAADKDDLLDRLIDHDPGAMAEFQRRLREGRS